MGEEFPKDPRWFDLGREELSLHSQQMEAARTETPRKKGASPQNIWGQSPILPSQNPLAHRGFDVLSFIPSLWEALAGFLDCYVVGSLDFNLLEKKVFSTKPQKVKRFLQGGSRATKLHPVRLAFFHYSSFCFSKPARAQRF